jgi:hypothetical protein
MHFAQRDRRLATRGWARIVCFGLTVMTLSNTVSCGGSDDTDSGASNAACEPKSVTLTARGTDASAPTLPADDSALAAAVASSFCATFTVTYPGGKTVSNPVVTDKEAVCIGDRLVERLGAAKVRALRLGLSPWGLLGFALSNNVERTDAEQIVDTFKACSKSWKLLLIMSVTEGADEISDASAKCASERLSDSDARTVFVGELDRAYDDRSQTGAQPFPELIEPLIAVFDQCLSPAELDALDWD